MIHSNLVGMAVADCYLKLYILKTGMKKENICEIQLSKCNSWFSAYLEPMGKDVFHDNFMLHLET